MKKLKVMTVIGTRPEIIRLSRVMALLDQETEHIIVHTGQNYDYELNEVFFEDLELRKPDYFLNAAMATPAKTIGALIGSVDDVLAKEQPDALLVVGDTNSCLAVIPAKRRKIPIFHMEAGNRCFDFRVPEEINRRIVDHTSDINMPYSAIAREYLLREGLSPDRIIKTGSPMFEVLNYYMPKIDSSNILQQLQLQLNDYFVVSCHREENVDSEANFTSFTNALNALAKEYGKRIIVSTHPRTRNRIEQAGVIFDPLIELMKPLGFLDFVKLQKHAFIVLSDSGTITEESSILNFPAVNIRDAHERPEGMEECPCILTGMNSERIIQAVEILSKQNRLERDFRLIADYSMPNVSAKVLRIILGYTDFVKKIVWRMEC